MADIDGIYIATGPILGAKISNIIAVPAVAGDPTVVVVAPADLTKLGRGDVVVVDVKEPGGGSPTTVFMLHVDFPGLDHTELVHDGTAFSRGWTNVGLREAITGGYRYTVRPDSGLWLDTPTLLVRRGATL